MSKVAYCANQNCGADFLRLSDGKLFVCPNHNSRVAWLCELCMKRFTIEWHGGEAVLVRIHAKAS